MKINVSFYNHLVLHSSLKIVWIRWPTELLFYRSDKIRVWLEHVYMNHQRNNVQTGFSILVSDALAYMWFISKIWSIVTSHVRNMNTMLIVILECIARLGEPKSTALCSEDSTTDWWCLHACSSTIISTYWCSQSSRNHWGRNCQTKHAIKVGYF